MTLSVADLSRTLGGSTILQGIDLEVPTGSLVGLLGPNGSGKTTLLRTIAGLGTPDTGTVHLDDSDLIALPRRERGRTLALVEQEAATDLDLSVLDVVLLGRIPYRRPLQGDREIDFNLAMTALEQVGMVELAERRWPTLSGGERQRTHLARALVQQPRLMLLDEPTNHLDVGHQLQFLSLVRNTGITALAALHDLNLAATFCDRLVVLADGHLVATGPVAEVLTVELLDEVFGVSAEVTHSATGRVHIQFHPPVIEAVHV